MGARDAQDEGFWKWELTGKEVPMGTPFWAIDFDYGDNYFMVSGGAGGLRNSVRRDGYSGIITHDFLIISIKDRLVLHWSLDRRKKGKIRREGRKVREQQVRKGKVKKKGRD